MASLEARVQLLEDEQAILDTLYAYGHGLDYGLEDTWIDCWTPDAILDWPGRALMQGHDALRQGFRSHTHAPDVFHKHIVIDPVITIDGDTASVLSMFARLDRYPGGPRIRAFGRYRDALVRCPDGRWRMCSRYPDIESIRTEAPLGAEPFPDSEQARRARGGVA